MRKKNRKKATKSPYTSNAPPLISFCARTFWKFRKASPKFKNNMLCLLRSSSIKSFSFERNKKPLTRFKNQLKNLKLKKPVFKRPRCVYVNFFFFSKSREKKFFSSLIPLENTSDRLPSKRINIKKIFFHKKKNG